MYVCMYIPFLVANEAIDSIVRGNSSVVLCKLDLEKAHDHVDWSFLLPVPTKMSFGEQWISWISWCIYSASFFVMINGSPCGFFQSSRGLRQGDSLSPYFFCDSHASLQPIGEASGRRGFSFDF